MGMLATRLINAFLLFNSGVVAAALSPVGCTHTREHLLRRRAAREEVSKPAGPAPPEGESPRLYMVTAGGKTGFIDRTGKIVIAPKFDLMWFPHAWSGEEEDFSEGMARIKVAAGRSPLTTFTKYLNGFIDAEGKVRIPPAYFHARRGDRMEQGQNRRKSYRRVEDLYRRSIEEVKDYAIFMTDPGGLVVSWNLGAECILGCAEDEITGQSASPFFTPEDLERGEDERELATAATEGRAEDERWHVRSDGTRFRASGVVTPVRGDW